MFNVACKYYGLFEYVSVDPCVAGVKQVLLTAVLPV